MKAFVTGGAGFIGSHLVDSLISDGHKVVVFDNFKTGQNLFLSHLSGNSKFKLIKGDIKNLDFLISSMENSDIVFHLAANADVRGGINNPTKDFDENIHGTKNILESMRLNRVGKIVFASSATVYGNPKSFPTYESSELIQTSIYGASKLAGEAMIQAYSEYYDIKSWIFRFVSWVGERYTHGVVFDFMRKLLINSDKLEILGNGDQNKSFLYVKDGVKAILLALKIDKGNKSIYNLGHNYGIRVIDVANIICDELGYEDVEFSFTGGKSGWKGDSPKVLLNLEKINSIGWFPETSIESGIRKTVRYLNQNQNLLSLKK